MVYRVEKNKEAGLTQLVELVGYYENYKDTFSKPTYNETQLRNDFLDPLLKSFGWDVDNEDTKNQFLREVIQEESIEIEDETSKKNPDYTLRVDGNRKLFIEAKKPSVNIIKSAKSAFQIRRYGWNANLGISVLTNFETLIIYDCRHKPSKDDDVHVARVRVFNYLEFIEYYDEIYELISFESAVNGRLDELFSTHARIGLTFDDYFLDQIENWRKKLAQSAIMSNKGLTTEAVNFLIQRLLNRIIFLRICEDRTLEKYETLKKITSYDQLKSLFQLSDKKYNSGLFDFIEDNLTLNIELDSEVLIEIFNELYYPQSPYDFSVVDPAILSQVYEKFLGSHIVLDNKQNWSIEFEPEVVASNGVVPTPKLVVDQIVKKTLHPLESKKTENLRIADICCGSGTFLISVYEFLLRSMIETLIKESQIDPNLIYKMSSGSYVLTLKAKRKVLEENIFGVDINPYAVEVTKFSLLLKLLEGESRDTLDQFIHQHNTKALPNLENNIKCGNSLVDNKFFKFNPNALKNDSLLFKVKPFDWDLEFPFLKNKDGFDAIVGNPPYVRIQNLVKYSSEEIKFYQNKVSGYTVANRESFDKYYLFIQRAIELLSSSGFLGYIVPHKFFIIKGGKSLRKYIRETSCFSNIIHFGVTQVFPGRATYTTILILQKEKTSRFSFKRIEKISSEAFSSKDNCEVYDQKDFGETPWIFISKHTSAVFDKLKKVETNPLKKFADICVGLQTSADKVYIFIPESETEKTYKFRSDNKLFEIEKEICRPCIYNLQFELFDTIQPNAQIIFPYIVEKEKTEIISEALFMSNYPLCWEYLNFHKTTLLKRNLNGKDPKWYQFGRSQSLARFVNTDKLIWPVLSTKPSYIYDTNNIKFTGGGNGPYYSLLNNSNYSILYFMGILAHPIFESLIKSGASEFRGRYYSHGRQFIENLPIRMINFNNREDVELYNSVISSVSGLISISKELKNVYGSDKKVLVRKKDIILETLKESVNNLYSLNNGDIDVVMKDKMLVEELKGDQE